MVFVGFNGYGKMNFIEVLWYLMMLGLYCVSVDLLLIWVGIDCVVIFMIVVNDGRECVVDFEIVMG